MSTILVIHGPNLNMLGTREPETYGSQTLVEINDRLTALTPKHHQLTSYQSNSESALIDKIHQAHNKVDFIVINPGALTHTSIALRDALLSIAVPFVEVHLSNVYAREQFRQKSYLSDIAVGVITGLGTKGYEMALQWYFEKGTVS